jgi:hypothetical protein
VTEQARLTFEDAISRVQPAAQSEFGRLRTMADAPDEVGLEFGLELSAEAGAFIASATGSIYKSINDHAVASNGGRFSATIRR